jgi:23S rRNA (cytidine1920-2'-O)/16S rRNA (cytidine1409-2'-O)-methyltransferase
MRLDQLLVEEGLADSRTRAQGLIRAGNVLVDDCVVDKPGTKIAKGANLRLRGAPQRFVGRGGKKLLGAFQSFSFDCQGKVCADIGASTGGFTDCLLQHGAARVYAVDVGYGQLAWKLRKDPRVVVMERTNARHLESMPEPIQIVVADLSFISIGKVMPAIIRIAAPSAEAVLLIKPQFEVGPGRAKGGIVKDPELREGAILECIASLEALGCRVLDRCPSPLPGAKKGNVEELVHLRISAAPEGQ